MSAVVVVAVAVAVAVAGCNGHRAAAATTAAPTTTPKATFPEPANAKPAGAANAANEDDPPLPPTATPTGASKAARAEFEWLASTATYLNGQLDAAHGAIPNRCNLDNAACARSWQALAKLLHQIDAGVFHFRAWCKGSSKWARLHAQRMAAHRQHLLWRRAKLDAAIAERLGPDATTKERFAQMQPPVTQKPVQGKCNDW